MKWFNDYSYFTWKKKERKMKRKECMLLVFEKLAMQQADKSDGNTFVLNEFC